MQRLKAKRRRPVFTPFTSNPPAAAFLQNIIPQSNLQKANLHFWDHPCPNSSWFIQEKLWKISHQKNWWTFTKKKTQNLFWREREREIFLSSRFFMAAESWMISDEDLIFHYLGRVVGFLAEVHWDPFVRSFWSFVGPFHTVAQIQTPFPSKINSKNNLRTTLLEKKTLEWRARPERKDVSIHSISIQINLIDIDEVKMWNSKFFQNLSFAR